jgi:hypothetical protein
LSLQRIELNRASAHARREEPPATGTAKRLREESHVSPIARRSQLSAKQMRTMLIVTCASVLSVAYSGPGSTAFGQSSPSLSGSVAERTERLNREDVDTLLTKARAAIKAGNLDEADTHVRRICACATFGERQVGW